jgi:hypothetical protein
MALTVTVEDGSLVEGANSWASVDDLDAYCEAHVNGATVLALDDEPKKQLLIQSARLMKNRLVWQKDSELVDADQAMPVPRNYFYDREGNEIGGDVVPQVVIDAQCELCINLQAENYAANASAAVTYERVDVIAVAYKEGTATKRKGLPDLVLEMLNPLATLVTEQPRVVRRG